MFGFWTKAQQQQQSSMPPSTEPSSMSSSSPLASTRPAVEETGSVPATDLAVTISADLAEARPSTPSMVSASTDIAAPRPSTDTDIAEIQKVPRALMLQVDAAPISNQNTSEPPRRTRRLSFQSFSFGQSKNKHPAEHISHAKQVEKQEAAEEAFKERRLVSTREGRKVDKAAAALANIILGPVHMVASTAASVTTYSRMPIQFPKPKPAGPQTIQKVQNQLLTPKQANKVIAKLRTIDPAEESPDPPPHKHPQLQHMHKHRPGERPIHAVCLDCTDEEADEYHFSKLATTREVEMRNSRKHPALAPSPQSGETSFAFADITTIVPVLRSMKLVTLVTAPDLGFGQPPDSPGLLAGSVPSVQAFAGGLQEMTGQLMALGFATSKVVFPNHAGVYPPTDRMSVLTYWWGLELCIPPPSIVYLANVKSIQNAMLNFLTAFSLINSGVKEILPFVRYIAQFLDFEWSAIKAQDHGDGVVCAATWVMPAALVPRPWDFAPPLPEKALPMKESDGEPPEPPAKVNPALNGPTLAFPGSKNGLFTPNALELPPVMITPPTLPRGIGAPPNGKGRANPFPLS